MKLVAEHCPVLLTDWTDFGKSVVKEMNNMNMFIDVSHINQKGFWDVVKTTNKPIIATLPIVYNLQPP